jgi:hypothetical protein
MTFCEDYTYCSFEESLKNQTLSKIEVDTNDEYIDFITTHGNRYRLVHFQDCCEYVTIDDICGDLDDLIGEPLLEVEEIVSETPDHLPAVDKVKLILEDTQNGYLVDNSQTWSFYKLRTRKGEVTLRFYGSSNVYYSETVSFIEMKK